MRLMLLQFPIKRIKDVRFPVQQLLLLPQVNLMLAVCKGKLAAFFVQLRERPLLFLQLALKPLFFGKNCW